MKYTLWRTSHLGEEMIWNRKYFCTAVLDQVSDRWDWTWRTWTSTRPIRCTETSLWSWKASWNLIRPSNPSPVLNKHGQTGRRENPSNHVGVNEWRLQPVWWREESSIVVSLIPRHRDEDSKKTNGVRSRLDACVGGQQSQGQIFASY
jgi:hypothetical protein